MTVPGGGDGGCGNGVSWVGMISMVIEVIVLSNPLFFSSVTIFRLYRSSHRMSMRCVWWILFTVYFPAR